MSDLTAPTLASTTTAPRARMLPQAALDVLPPLVAASVSDTLSGAIEAAETGPLPAHPGFVRLVRFGAIGSLGFVWDTATTYATRGLIGLLPAAILAFVVAATLNWAANRLWTFRDCRSDRSLFHQWALYMAANSLGFVLNRGSFTVLVLASATCRAHPVIPLAVGAVAALAANFSLSHRVVFRHAPRPPAP